MVEQPPAIMSKAAVVGQRLDPAQRMTLRHPLLGRQQAQHRGLAVRLPSHPHHLRANSPSTVPSKFILSICRSSNALVVFPPSPLLQPGGIIRAWLCRHHESAMVAMAGAVFHDGIHNRVGGVEQAYRTLTIR